MKKIYTLIFVSFLFIACGDNSSSATDFASEDLGEGYTYSTSIRYDKATGILYYGTSGCAYHPDTKTFSWEDGIRMPDSDRVNIVGDSLWIGPVVDGSDTTDDDDFFNYLKIESLLLSNDHNGLYGTWKSTNCEREVGTTYIHCGGSGASITTTGRVIFTKDSLYNTVYAVSRKPWPTIRSQINSFGFLIQDYDIENFIEAHYIEVISTKEASTEFKIGGQIFKTKYTIRLDKDGETLTDTFTHNGISCSRIRRSGVVTKEMCLEKDEAFLLSDVNLQYERDIYPITSFGLDNYEEFIECNRSLLSEENLAILSANQWTY